MNMEHFIENVDILCCITTLALLCFAIMCFSFAYDKFDEIIKKKKK